MAKPKKTAAPVAENILPAGSQKRILIDLDAVKENYQRSRVMLPPGRPARLLPAVVVVDEGDAVHRARSIRIRGEVVLTEVNSKELERGVHALRGAVWMALTSDEVELIQK